MSADWKSTRIDELTTVGVDKSRAQRLKEIREEQGLHSLDSTITMLIESYELVSGFERFSQTTQKNEK